MSTNFDQMDADALLAASRRACEGYRGAEHDRDFDPDRGEREAAEWEQFCEENPEFIAAGIKEYDRMLAEARANLADAQAWFNRLDVNTDPAQRAEAEARIEMWELEIAQLTEDRMYGDYDANSPDEVAARESKRLEAIAEDEDDDRPDPDQDMFDRMSAEDDAVQGGYNRAAADAEYQRRMEEDE